MATNNKEFDFNTICVDVYKDIRTRAIRLHQEVEGSIVGDDCFNYYVPCENWTEARRRVDFAYAMMRKYKKYLVSRQPIRNLFGFLNRRLRKIDEELELSRQIAFDFMQETRKKSFSELSQERKEVLEFKHLVLDPASYFDAVHHVASPSRC